MICTGKKYLNAIPYYLTPGPARARARVKPGYCI